MPKGSIVRLMPDKGFGFIQDTNGLEYFFHRSGLINADFDSLAVKNRVTFDAVDAPKGRRAEQVVVIE